MWNSNSSFVYSQELSELLKRTRKPVPSLLLSNKLGLPARLPWDLSPAGSTKSPTLRVQNFQSLQREEKSPFIMFSFLRCFISLKTSLTTKWSLSGLIGKRWRRFSGLSGWKISKLLSALKANIAFDLFLFFF